MLFLNSLQNNIFWKNPCKHFCSCKSRRNTKFDILHWRKWMPDVSPLRNVKFCMPLTFTAAKVFVNIFSRKYYFANCLEITLAGAKFWTLCCANKHPVGTLATVRWVRERISSDVQLTLHLSRERWHNWGAPPIPENIVSGSMMAWIPRQWIWNVCRSRAAPKRLDNISLCLDHEWTVNMRCSINCSKAAKTVLSSVCDPLHKKCVWLSTITRAIFEHCNISIAQWGQKEPWMWLQSLGHSSVMWCHCEQTWDTLIQCGIRCAGTPRGYSNFLQMEKTTQRNRSHTGLGYSMSVHSGIALHSNVCGFGATFNALFILFGQWRCWNIRKWPR